MKETLAVTSALLLGMALLMLGAGLQATLLGVRATLEGFPTFVTGIVMSGYYLGYVAGSLRAPELVSRVGHIRVFAALTAIAAATILVQGVFVHPIAWALLRASSGFCFAGIYVVAESWLNDRVDNQQRGTLLAVYMVVIYSGLGLGQFLLNLADPASLLLFVLIAVLISLAVVPMALSVQRAPDFSLPHRVRFRDLLEVSPLGTAGVFFSGMLSAMLLAVGPVYAARSGLSSAAVATFMALSILPAVLVQLPIGRYSDRVDRRTVLIVMSTLAASVALAAVWLGSRATVPFYAAVAVYGGVSLSSYALCVSHINDHLRPEQMVAASGTIILLNGAGAILGPLLVTSAMQATGPAAYFATAAVIHVLFAAFALWRKGKTAPIPSDSKGQFVGTLPQAAPTGRLTVPDAAAPEGS